MTFLFPALLTDANAMQAISIMINTFKKAGIEHRTSTTSQFFRLVINAEKDDCVRLYSEYLELTYQLRKKNGAI